MAFADAVPGDREAEDILYRWDLVSWGPTGADRQNAPNTSTESLVVRHETPVGRQVCTDE